MSTDERLKQCFKLLKSISKGKIAGFDEALTILQDEAATNGLEIEDMQFLIEYITGTELRASLSVPLIKCLIPKNHVESKAMETMIDHWMAAFKDLNITVSIIIIQWVIGLWEYQLVDRQRINMYYDCFFYLMLKRERLEPHLARLIYMLTKPDDVTRRQVNRLLELQTRYSKPRKHINALLSLFKSYKPDLVPEKIPSINIESVWKPIPDALIMGFEDAKERGSVHEHRRREHFDWNSAKTTSTKKNGAPLLPSVRYFHIGSSIYKDKDSKSIFDLSTFEDLGKYHFSVEMPCNATSLLANTAGYHFLAFADFAYQSRFCYNLFNTLRRAYLLEKDKFSSEQMEQLLDMTIEFSRYMQEGIPVVNSFLEASLVYLDDKYRSKFLELMQWNTAIPVTDMESYVNWIYTIFIISSLEEKCEIIASLRKWVVNLFVRHRFGNDSRKPSSFLGQVPASDLSDMHLVLINLANNLVISGLTTHSHHPLIMYAALDFYDEICRLEVQSNLPMWTIAPSTLIYGGLVSKSCATFSRVCGLLLRYRDMYGKITEMGKREDFKIEIGCLDAYATDFQNVLWNNSLFSSRKAGRFLSTVSKKTFDELPGTYDYKDGLLSFEKHPAILPYKYTLSTGGLIIEGPESVLNVAKLYFPPVSDFIMSEYCRK